MPPENNGYTISDIARLANVSIGKAWWWSKLGKLNPPHLKVGKRYYWTEEEAKTNASLLSENDPNKKQLVGVYDLSVIANKYLCTVYDAIKQGRIPPPTIIKGRRRYYTQIEAQICNSILNVPKVTQHDIQLAAGIADASFYYHVKKGNIPAPTLKIGANTYYTPEEALKVKAWLEEYYRIKKTYYLYGPGMRKLKATFTELRNAKKFVGEPTVICGNQLRNRFYTLTQLKEAIRKVRTEHEKKGKK